MVTLCLTFWSTARLFFKVPAPFYIPASSLWQFVSLHPCQHLLRSDFFILVGACFSGCEVLCHCAYFNMLIGHFCILFGEMSLLLLGPLLIVLSFCYWVVRFFIYIIFIYRHEPVIRYMLCKYFLIFCGLSFQFLDSVLSSIKFKILMKSFPGLLPNSLSFP